MHPASAIHTPIPRKLELMERMICSPTVQSLIYDRLLVCGPAPLFHESGLRENALRYPSASADFRLSCECYHLGRRFCRLSNPMSDSIGGESRSTWPAYRASRSPRPECPAG